jgi:hypothetical protein
MKINRNGLRLGKEEFKISFREFLSDMQGGVAMLSLV